MAELSVNANIPFAYRNHLKTTHSCYSIALTTLIYAPQGDSGNPITSITDSAGSTWTNVISTYFNVSEASIWSTTGSAAVGTSGSLSSGSTGTPVGPVGTGELAVGAAAIYTNSPDSGTFTSGTGSEVIHVFGDNNTEGVIAGGLGGITTAQAYTASCGHGDFFMMNIATAVGFLPTSSMEAVFGGNQCQV